MQTNGVSSSFSSSSFSSSSSFPSLREDRPEIEPHKAYYEALADLTQWPLALLGAKLLFKKKQASFFVVGSISFAIFIIFLWMTRTPMLNLPKHVKPIINLVVPILNCVVCGLIVDSILDTPVFKSIIISIYIMVSIVTVPDHNYVLGGFKKALRIVYNTGCTMFNTLYNGFGASGNHGNSPMSQQFDSGGSSHDGYTV